MVIRVPRVTEAQFVAFVHQDENLDRTFELINGEIIEVPPGRSTTSRISLRISHKILQFCEENGLPDYISGEAGTYRVLGNAIAPDVAYRTTPLIEDYPDPMPPEFAVEVLSPTDKKRDVARKRQIYLDAEILYWEVYVPQKCVHVYAPGHPMRSYTLDETLDGGDVLPGFKLPVHEIFGLFL